MADVVQVGKKFSGQDVLDGTPEDPFRATKEMLVALNLQKFEKNFKKGQLTDNTLTLLTEGCVPFRSVCVQCQIEPPRQRSGRGRGRGRGRGIGGSQFSCSLVTTDRSLAWRTPC